ncbi:glucuronosyltransferase sqv-8-like protein [Dinothrombium tinctorium]|uniref:Galactosylgalactosylxylosylprotein 3-beta-glucuronosyltransferase n=1 Tax=Dinothrombium tinctorium TaxID=1965070 RepID=A0A443QMN8_9ACAR|nr:glucuronosyltransferase sqv-8-like protein [Dinothrombium tinctorium]
MKRFTMTLLILFATCIECPNKNYANQASDSSANLATVEIQTHENSVNEVAQLSDVNSTESTPVVYVITPTYTRATQMADLTRLAQTLMLVKNVFWIVSEDSNEINFQISELLNRTGIASLHLLGPRPANHKDVKSGRGVSNRLRALKWIRENLMNGSKEGVIYFADDDNTYDIRIFEEMRNTKKVSVWPVGLISKLGVSAPILDKHGKVIGFHDPFIEPRKFALDMAGFATNLQFFLSKPNATMPYKVGYEEDYFIQSLDLSLSDLEPKAENCTQVYVWHTKTIESVFPSFSSIEKQKEINETNVAILYKNILNGINLN